MFDNNIRAVAQPTHFLTWKVYNLNFLYIYMYIYILYICTYIYTHYIYILYIYTLYIHIYCTHISRSLGCYQGIRPRHGHRNGKTRWNAWKKNGIAGIFLYMCNPQKEIARPTRATIYPTKPPSSLKCDAWFPTGAGTNLCNCNKPVCDSWGQDHEIV